MNDLQEFTGGDSLYQLIRIQRSTKHRTADNTTTVTSLLHAPTASSFVIRGQRFKAIFTPDIRFSVYADSDDELKLRQ